MQQWPQKLSEISARLWRQGRSRRIASHHPQSPQPPLPRPPTGVAACRPPPTSLGGEAVANWNWGRPIDRTPTMSRPDSTKREPRPINWPRASNRDATRGRRRRHSFGRPLVRTGRLVRTGGAIHSQLHSDVGAFIERRLVTSIIRRLAPGRASEWPAQSFVGIRG